MKTTLIAAGALIATTLTGLPEASAKDVNFGLTIAGKNGVIQISGPGHNNGRGYGRKGQSYGYQGYRPYQTAPGYGRRQTYPGPYYGRHDRRRRHCMNPNEIRHWLRYQGWQGFRVKKLTSGIAVIHSHRNGMRYRLKINRCSGEMLKVKPIGGYGPRGYY